MEDESPITEELKNTLIDLVFAEEMLWNMKADVYRNTKNKSKEEKWKAIAKILNISTKTAKSVWKNLRTYYSKELKCVVGTSGDEGGDDTDRDADTAVYTGTWPHFGRLRFLSDSMTPRRTSGNLDQLRLEENQNTSLDFSQLNPCIREENVVLNDDLIDSLVLEDDSFLVSQSPATTSKCENTSSDILIVPIAADYIKDTDFRNYDRELRKYLPKKVIKGSSKGWQISSQT